MPINIRDANDQIVPVGSASVGGNEHQSAHLRHGSTSEATPVTDATPLPAGLRGWITSAWQAIHALTLGSKNAITVAVLDASGNHIVSFGGTPGPVSPYVNVTTAAVFSARLKAAAGKLRSIHVTPSDTEVGAIYVSLHDSIVNPPGATDGFIAKWGIGGGFPSSIEIPGGGIATATGVGIRIVKNAALTDDSPVTAGTLIMVTYE